MTADKLQTWGAVQAVALLVAVFLTVLRARGGDPPVDAADVLDREAMDRLCDGIAQAYHLALTRPLSSRFEVFHIFHQRPGVRFPIDKARRILGFEPRHNCDGLWRREDTT